MEFSTIIIVYLGCTIKILFAVAGAVPLGLVGWKLSVTVFAGGMTGITFFALAGTRIRHWLALRRVRRGKKINFSKAKKYLKIWRRFGIVGVAALTPPLLSPMVGPVLAAAFGEKFGRIMLFMSISLAVWSVIFGVFAQTIHDLIKGH